MNNASKPSNTIKKKPSGNLVPTMGDALEEFRYGNPDPKTVARIVGFTGVASILIPLTEYLSNDFANATILFVKQYYMYILSAPVIFGLFCFAAAIGIYQRLTWGKRMAQFLCIIFLPIFLAALAIMIMLDDLAIKPNVYIPMIFGGLIALSADLVFIYSFVKYLERLPVDD